MTLLPRLQALVAAAPPVDPDGDEAREWAKRELSDPAYAEAEPTPLDLLARAIGDVFASLFGAQAAPGVGSLVLVGVAIAIVVVIVVSFVIWGRPRGIPRAGTPFDTLFGEAETRSAAELRALAGAAAGAADWNQAVILRLRALARALQERGVVDLPPGATVHAFSRAAGRAFPAHAAAVDSAADAFDDVRYLRRPGTAELYQRVVAADDALQTARADTDALTPRPVGVSA